ncbi:LysR family transcriptional regulator [Cupriavidus lacunae]|uniref:LysR family transcriptional regulator n=1 Tax=Cupriavidus lacunae TaxID=2666307 RepID=A0A370P0C8_9BURK|nr:LysR family transcriptional regulator [Cupriavidus lacunae]RDK11304.1 LysR family transcriptional regulator [Cupriavidus lacunae]
MSEPIAGNLSTVEMFCAAARANGFTAAATALGTTPSAISKAVRRLEDRLGVKLFERTTRAIRLTDDGLAYYRTCSLALESIQEIERSLTGHKLPRGELRVSVPHSYGIKRLIPLIPRYVERYHGQVRVAVSLSNSLADFVAEDFDMAIRIGEVTDSRLVCRPLHEAGLRVVASPAYLRRRGIPATPEDLGGHECLGLVLPDSGRVMPWSLAATAGELRIRPRMRFDHPLGTLTAALSDAGLAQLLDFTVEEDLRSGRLVEVLAGFRPASQPVSAVWPGNRHLSAKVRTFLDFLIEASEG